MDRRVQEDRRTVDDRKRGHRVTSQARDQLANPHAEGFRNPQQIVHGRRLLAALNPADEHRREVCLLSKLFLTELGAYPLSANGLAQDAAVFWSCCHGDKDKTTALMPPCR